MACKLGASTPVDTRNDGMAQGLCDVARLLERSEHVEALWLQLAARIATLLDAQSCWLVLAGAGREGDGAVHAYKSDGTTQVKKSAGARSGVHPMLARASAMLVLQASAPEHSQHVGPHVDQRAGDNAIFIPIRVDGMVLGVLHIQGSKRNRPFDAIHYETGQLIAFLIGKALHLDRLQKIANSRFAQLSLLRHAEPGTVTLRHALRHPKATANLMAKSFYQEMAKAGFTPPEIIAAASAIISELTSAMKERSQKR